MAERSIDASAEDEAIPADLLRQLESAATAVFEAEGAGDAELSIALVGDDTIARLNQEYLQHEGPTDVISFPLDDPARGRVLGDIYIGYAQADRQSTDFGVPLREELIRLVVHGTLHILGWDHKDEGSGMFVRQEELVKKILNFEF